MQAVVEAHRAQRNRAQDEVALLTGRLVAALNRIKELEAAMSKPATA
jgi:hypothetical protein